ncbi:MAG: hypothetical protein EVJ48_03040 [Candidatus Acidulodesulfobacterium acidiphilum]|uniref:Conjugal transfer protein TraB n=1 Tax=Candidatus Acidulodesulfobacterium acidiphilum TaxID=2597224 RepID=A0A520XFE3_9DELT|nr:MAG: hypothetical protein EVJ48_03040 [Candidatus Acidulodesulfobacterium acidiphilum]
MADDLNFDPHAGGGEEKDKLGPISRFKSLFKTRKQWQMFIFGAVFFVLSAIFAVIIFVVLPARKPHLIVKASPNVVNLVNSDKLSKQAWVSSAATKLQENNKEIEALKKRNAVFQKELHDMAVIKQSREKGGNKVIYPPIPGQEKGLAFTGSSNGGKGYTPAAGSSAKQSPVTIVPLNNPINTILNSQPSPTTQKSKKKRTLEYYVPSGTFTEATLLNGMDAPASMKGKSNPYPALIRLTDLSFLPNEFRSSLKGCFIIAEGYGSLSSERVYIRAVNLSCVVRGGVYHVDVPLHGYIVGQHGKVGLRGKVVTKQGAILAREFAAGLLQGFGNIISQQSMTYSMSALGSTSTINPGNIGQAAVGQGLTNAANNLSQFYIKMADSMVPVVEVGAGRKLTIVITKGFWIKDTPNVRGVGGNSKTTKMKGGK